MRELQNWYGDPANADELQVLIDSAIFQKAINLLITTHLPAPTLPAQSAADKVTDAAHYWHYFSGFHDFHRKLKNLATPIKQSESSIPEAYSKEWLEEWAKKQESEK